MCTGFAEVRELNSCFWSGCHVYVNLYVCKRPHDTGENPIVWQPFLKKKKTIKRLVDVSRDQRAGLSLDQRISIAIQRVSLLRTFSIDVNADESF